MVNPTKLDSVLNKIDSKMSCEYKTSEISKQEYIGTSLPKINEFFEALNDDVCILDAELQKKLKVENQGVRFAYNTHVINFSGNNVIASRSGFEEKTIMVPITGVTHLYSTDDWQNVGGLQIVSKKGSANTVDDKGEGVVTIVGHIPTQPRQIQTFFYFGPNAATDPTSNTFSNTNTIPQSTYIESFINDTLRHRGNRQGDICYVVFQKNGYNLIFKEQAQNVATSFSNRTHTHTGIRKTVTMTGGANKSFYQYKQRDSYIEMLPRFIVYKLTYRPSPTNPSVLRFQLEYVNNVPQIWEETSFVNNITVPAVPTTPVATIAPPTTTPPPITTTPPPVTTTPPPVTTTPPPVTTTPPPVTTTPPPTTTSTPTITQTPPPVTTTPPPVTTTPPPVTTTPPPVTTAPPATNTPDPALYIGESTNVNWTWPDFNNPYKIITEQSISFTAVGIKFPGIASSPALISNPVYKFDISILPQGGSTFTQSDFVLPPGCTWSSTNPLTIRVESVTFGSIQNNGTDMTINASTGNIKFINNTSTVKSFVASARFILPTWNGETVNYVYTEATLTPVYSVHPISPNPASYPDTTLFVSHQYPDSNNPYKVISEQSVSFSADGTKYPGVWSSPALPSNPTYKLDIQIIPRTGTTISQSNFVLPAGWTWASSSPLTIHAPVVFNSQQNNGNDMSIKANENFVSLLQVLNDGPSTLYFTAKIRFIVPTWNSETVNYTYTNQVTTPEYYVIVKPPPSPNPDNGYNSATFSALIQTPDSTNITRIISQQQISFSGTGFKYPGTNSVPSLPSNPTYKMEIEIVPQSGSTITQSNFSLPAGWEWVPNTLTFRLPVTVDAPQNNANNMGLKSNIDFSGKAVCLNTGSSPVYFKIRLRFVVPTWNGQTVNYYYTTPAAPDAIYNITPVTPDPAIFPNNTTIATFHQIPDDQNPYRVKNGQQFSFSATGTKYPGIWSFPALASNPTYRLEVELKPQNGTTISQSNFTLPAGWTWYSTNPLKIHIPVTIDARQNNGNDMSLRTNINFPSKITSTYNGTAAKYFKATVRFIIPTWNGQTVNWYYHDGVATTTPTFTLRA